VYGATDSGGKTRCPRCARTTIAERRWVMGSRGFPRWMRGKPGEDERNRKCYAGLLQELQECAEVLTRGCAVCPQGVRCLRAREAQAAAGRDIAA